MTFLATFLLLAAVTPPQSAPDLAGVLQRATEYVTRYEAELGSRASSRNRSVAASLLHAASSNKVYIKE